MILAHLDPGSDWSYAGIAGLGAFHGINPAMGWLFAVAVGLQLGSRRALLVALIPLAIGHELSVLPTLIMVEELHVIASENVIRIAGASALGAFGLWKLVRGHRHHRWVGMHLGYGELAIWSFLMASAHGAGLMLIPFAVTDDHDGTAVSVVASGALDATAAACVHTAAMAVVAGSVALLVYEIFGVSVLRRVWLNLDRAWAGALLAGAVATLFIA